MRSLDIFYFRLDSHGWVIYEVSPAEFDTLDEMTQIYGDEVDKCDILSINVTVFQECW